MCASEEKWAKQVPHGKRRSVTKKNFSMLETFSSNAEHVYGTQGLPGDSEDNVLAVGNAYWRLETRARRKEC